MFVVLLLCFLDVFDAFHDFTTIILIRYLSATFLRPVP